LNEFDLVITTFALAQRYGRIKSHAWNYIIPDEARAIKNPGTKQAKAVKSLTFSNRIIMTWTPIENRLSDIWSLFDSLQELLAGKFPKALGEIFTARDKGLFPSPKEIEFDCSCLDWADMCKHVAATLYGIGARLDEDPSLFFKLRKVKMADLITQAVEDKTQALLKKAGKKRARVIAESDIADVFGIDMEENIDISKTAVETRSRKKPGRSSCAVSGLKKGVKTAAAKAPTKKLSAGKKTAKLSGTVQIINIIKMIKKRR